MRFLIRIGIICLAMVWSYVGSLKLQNTNPGDFIIGGGMIALGVVALFLMTRKLWKVLGCFATLGLVIVFMGGMVLLVSGGDIVNNIMNAVTGKKSEAVSSEQQTAPVLPAQAAPTAAGQDASAVPADASAQPVAQQPAPPPPTPVLQGAVSKILGGDKIIVNGMPVRLYGIASPVLGQKCTDAHGRGYDCGYISARKLQEIIGSDSVSCKIMNQNKQGDLMAACSVSSFDIGAVMVEAGWAIALPNITPIYVPYEQKARQNKAGLWEGRFQAPWEWQAEQQQIQERASKIKIPKVSLPTQKKKKSIFDNF